MTRCVANLLFTLLLLELGWSLAAVNGTGNGTGNVSTNVSLNCSSNVNVSLNCSTLVTANLSATNYSGNSTQNVTGNSTSGTIAANSTSNNTNSTGPCVEVFDGVARQCCPSTGICQQSSCAAFGLSSSRANCHPSGANKKCADSYCNWRVPSCFLNAGHCYGTIACTGNGTNRTTCYGYGLPCVEDGNSVNYKVCAAACKDNKDCPSGSSCKTQGDAYECIEDELSTEALKALIATVYGQTDFTLGFTISMSLAMLLQLIRSILVTEVIPTGSNIYSYIDMATTGNVTSSLLQASISGASLLSMDIVSWATSAAKGVMMSAALTESGFQSLGLVMSPAMDYFTAFTLDQLSSSGQTLGNAFTFKLKLSKAVSNFVVLGHSKTYPLGIDITLLGGLLTFLSSNEVQVTVKEGMAFSIGTLDPPTTGVALSEVASYTQLKYRHTKFDLSGIITMAATDLELLAKAIKASEVITSAVSVFSYLVAVAAQEVQVMKSTAVDAIVASQLVIDDWGTDVAKVVSMSYEATQQGFSNMGITFDTNKKYAFMVSFDRLTTAGVLVNDRPITLTVTLPLTVTSLVIRSHSSSSLAGIDIVSEGGWVKFLGNGKWQFQCRHTSPITGEVATTDSTSGSESNTALFGLLALITLIPLVACCVGGLWWYHKKTSYQEPAYNAQATEGRYALPPAGYTHPLYPDPNGHMLTTTPVAGAYGVPANPSAFGAFTMQYV